MTDKKCRGDIGLYIPRLLGLSAAMLIIEVKMITYCDMLNLHLKKFEDKHEGVWEIMQCIIYEMHHMFPSP